MAGRLKQDVSDGECLQTMGHLFQNVLNIERLPAVL
jgi:hypothetical protein